MCENEENAGKANVPYIMLKRGGLRAKAKGQNFVKKREH